MTLKSEPQHLIQARIPTNWGEFRLCFFENLADGKEHLAIVYGDVTGREETLIRIHSECYTGDVLGSHRCDCGEQLHQALHLIAQEGRGVVLYLRQEGRGIGLRSKLLAYNLQDQGYDTVEANLLLGHAEDERDYSVAAEMLRQLGVPSVRLLTNNPTKLESLQELGITVTARVPLVPNHITPDNWRYLQTKVARMRHLLELEQAPRLNGASSLLWSHLEQTQPAGRPHVTLSYAQTLDGSVTHQAGQPLAISGAESLQLTHQLRALHQAILIGVDTVVADNPRLTVRLVQGENPLPVILDSHLRFPLTAQLLQQPQKPLILTTNQADKTREAQLQAAGAQVVRLPADEQTGRVSLPAAMAHLHGRGLSHLMVEGGAKVIASFLEAQLVDLLVVTISMQFLGGLGVMSQPLPHIPRLKNPRHLPAGRDLWVWGELEWEEKK